MAENFDCTYRVLAARYVRRQAKQLADQLEGVRQGEDIEFIHRARVASRRLRAALRMFRDCFGAKRIKKWRKQVRRVTEGLGDARDKDVQIEFLCGILCEMTEKACSPGIARLLARLEYERELQQGAVIRAVDRLQASKVIDEMLAETKGMLDDAKDAEAEAYGPAAHQLTQQYIIRHMEELLFYEESLQDAKDQQRHHAMRIAAKRLRYTTEISKPVYQGRLDPMIEAVKKVQTLLGDVHDCDVWMEHLAAFSEDERAAMALHFGHTARFPRLEAGIEYLRRNRLERRHQVFAELVDYWKQLQRQGMWDQLTRILAPCSEPLSAMPVTTPATPTPATAEGSVEASSSDKAVPRPLALDRPRALEKVPR